MNNTQKIVIAVVTVSAASGVVYNRVQAYYRDIEGRFPQIDKKIVRKAYRQFLKNAVTGQYPDLQTYNDDGMDRLFMDIVLDLMNEKK